MKRMLATALGTAALVLGATCAEAMILVDGFSFYQALVVNATNPNAYGVASGPEAIGGERDVEINLLNGASGTMYIDIGGNGVLSHGQNGSGLSRAYVIWDGSDGDATTLDATGLGAIDFTEGGTATAFEMKLVANDWPVPIRLDVFTDAGNWSRMSISTPGFISPLGPGVMQTYAYAGFSTMAGAGADFSNVGAIRMTIDGSITPAVDVQLDFLRSNGNPVPEPATALLLCAGLAGVASRRRRKA